MKTSLVLDLVSLPRARPRIALSQLYQGLFIIQCILLFGRSQYILYDGFLASFLPRLNGTSPGSPMFPMSLAAFS